MRRKFWLDTLERVARTFIQALAASLLVSGLDDWANALKIGAGAGVLAVAASLAGSRTGDPATGSFVKD